MELSERTTRIVLGAMVALFVLRLASHLGTDRLAGDEAQICAVAARTVAHGGPLYGNALTNYGPLSYSLVACVFRVAGLYATTAVRAVEVAWWAATALAVYAAARTVMGRAASLAAAGAYVLAAANPGFHEIRGEPLTGLPLAAAVGLAVRGLSRRRPLELALAGAAVGVAFLAKQQAAMALPAVAALPLLAWGWRRPWKEAWLAALRGALVVAGFAAVIGAVWLYYALRGAGHHFAYCVWSYNWELIRSLSPSGASLPPLPYVWWRVARYMSNEAWLPVALVGGVVGLCWRGPGQGGLPQGVPWRAWVASLVLLLGAMVWAACPRVTTEPSPYSYVHYQSLFYVPMCLLIGVCVEAGSRGRGKGLLLAAALGLALAYVLVPAARRWGGTLTFLAAQLRVPDVWGLLATGATLAAAGWLLGGRRAAWAAPPVWLAMYLGARQSLGSEGSHLAATTAMAALGLLWQASRRRSLALALAAGVVHAGACVLDWEPQVGLAAGAAVWVLAQAHLSRAERLALAAAYLSLIVAVGVALVAFGLTGVRAGEPLWWRLLSWHATLTRWVLACRLGLTLALAGALGVVLLGRGRALLGHPLGLLLCAAGAALVGGIQPGLGAGFLAGAGAAVALAAALAVGLLTQRPGSHLHLAHGGRVRNEDVTPLDGGPLALWGGCAAAALAAVWVGLAPPSGEAPNATQVQVARAVEAGSPGYVWGPLADMGVYARSRLVPAVPQVGTWMVGPAGAGRPESATLDGLDAALSSRPPRFLACREDMKPSLADLPRFGPILRTRYRAIERLPQGVLYRLVEPPVGEHEQPEAERLRPRD